MFLSILSQKKFIFLKKDYLRWIKNWKLNFADF